MIAFPIHDSFIICSIHSIETNTAFMEVVQVIGDITFIKPGRLCAWNIDEKTLDI